jgi:hypothetical protein
MKRSGVFLLMLFTLMYNCLGQDDLSVYTDRRKEYDERNKTLDKWVRASEKQHKGKPGLSPPRKNSLTKSEKARLAPAPEDLAKYAQFLKKGNTGIVKLLNLSDCSNRIIDVNDRRCLEGPQITGMGSLYSFRAKSYLETGLIDIRLSDDRFSGGYPLSYSLFTELGDLSLETVELKDETPLRKRFSAAGDISQLTALKKQFDDGVEIKGRRFSSSIPVKGQTSYLFYSGVYNGFRRSYDEIIVAFRVVRKEDDGSVVLLWRKL